MPLTLSKYGNPVRESILDLMTDQERPAQFFTEYEDVRIVVMNNIANLAHPNIKTRLKIFSPYEKILYAGNPFERVLTRLEAEPLSVGFRESDKIDRRFKLEGNPANLVEILLMKDFRLVSLQEYKLSDRSF